MTTNSRTAARVLRATETLEGDGVRIRRAFPTQNLPDLDPFLLLDQMGPVDYAPGQARGFPPHPHRGFETVTYVLEGEMEHRDSFGNHGRLGPGDVQWMTAGSGLVHSEMPGSTLRRDGGRLHGFQLWVNLSRRDKMMPPHYQEVPGKEIPSAVTPDRTVEARVIAGEALGQSGRIQTNVPITYLHLKLQPGARHEQPLPKTANAFVYVIRGEARIGADGAPASEGQFAIFHKDGDVATVGNDPGSGAPVEVLLIAGEPIGEPVVRGGPFVVNTKAELYQAFEDYQSGRMGRLPDA